MGDTWTVIEKKDNKHEHCLLCYQANCKLYGIWGTYNENGYFRGVCDDCLTVLNAFGKVPKTTHSKIPKVEVTGFACRIKSCTLNKEGVCKFIKGTSWINVLNCPNPAVFEKIFRSKIEEINAPEQIGFLGVTNIPLFRIECSKCHHTFISNDKTRELCDECRGFSILNVRC